MPDDDACVPSVTYRTTPGLCIANRARLSVKSGHPIRIGITHILGGFIILFWDIEVVTTCAPLQHYMETLKVRS